MVVSGQGQFKVKVTPESNCNCLDFYPEAGSGPSIECILVYKMKTVPNALYP